MQRVAIFAGQGSEEPGMGLRTDRRWLDEASRVTGVDLPRALERGGRALSRTEVLQPTLVAVGLAAAEALDVPLVAGHSLGELTAACWAAELSPPEAIELAALRGRLMAEQAEAHPGGMAAFGALPDLEGVEGVQLAAINTPSEVVLSGDRNALARLGGRALRVAGAWHSEHMRDAVEPYREAARRAFAGRRLRATVVSACEVGEVAIDRLPDVLAESLVRPVRFLDLVRWLEARGVREAALPEPGRTTRSLLRRASSERWTTR